MGLLRASMRPMQSLAFGLQHRTSNVPPMQQMLMDAGMDSGTALNQATSMMHQADPLAGQRLAAWLQQNIPQKKRSNHLGGGL